MKKFCGYCGSALKTASRKEEALEVDQKIFGAIKKKQPIMLLGDEDYTNNERAGILNIKINLSEITNKSFISKIKPYMKMQPQRSLDFAEKREETRKEESASTILVMVRADENGKLDQNSLSKLVSKQDLVDKPEKRIVTNNPIKITLKGKPQEVEYCHVLVLSIKPKEK